MVTTLSGMLRRIFDDSQRGERENNNMGATTTNDQNEARILTTNNILILLSNLKGERCVEEFCGTVIKANEFSADLPDFSGRTVYLAGDISKVANFQVELKAAQSVLVIEGLSSNFEIENSDWQVVHQGRVPILLPGGGVLYRRFFDPDIDYFNRICGEHEFQSLTESNKPGRAHRTGIYLTPVERQGEELHFRLLRCSTNFSGPTETFRENDSYIVDALNQEADIVFENHAPMNHVLAQVYHNTPASEQKKQTKAKISAHADKTKDMPTNGMMAFCTFYDQLNKLEPMAEDPFDYGFKKSSGLTRLVFRLKPPVAEDCECTLPSQFSVTLYPGSVFFMPLSTNRFYTHEIRASTLDAEKLPTRLGYVVRCSSTEAIHKDGATFLKTNGELKRLEPPTDEGMAELRKLYAQENKTADFIDYANKFMFSMNEGDYLAPE